MVSPFILHCFPFSLTGEQKGEKSLKRCWWIVWLILTYYGIILMAKCMYAWLHHPLKFISKCIVAMYRFKSARMVYVETYMRVLGLWFANIAAAKTTIKWVPWYVDWKILSSCTDSRTMKYVTFYTWTNRLTCFFTCNLPIQPLLCVNKLMLTST